MLSRTRGFLNATVNRFRSSKRGNLAIIFAIMSIPLMLALGGGIDYSRASLARSQLQDSLDATSLALSRQTGVATMTGAQMQSFARGYFDANFSNTDIDTSGVILTPSSRTRCPRR